MELRVLEYYLTILREGSVSAAAEVLHVSQPTLSRHIIELERELDTTLFTRGRGGITLTDDGMLLRARAAELVELARITESELQENKETIAGEIRIGCAEALAVDHVADVFRELQEEHPEVRLTISSAPAEDVVQHINHGLLDFGLLLSMNARWSLDSLTFPSEEQVVAIMPEDHPLASQNSIEYEDLVPYEVVVPSSYKESNILAGHEPVYEGGKLQAVAEYDLSFNASRLACAGLGVVITLEGLVSSTPENGLVTRPICGGEAWPAYLAWKPFDHKSRACEAFLNLARTRFVRRSREKTSAQ